MEHKWKLDSSRDPLQLPKISIYSSKFIWFYDSIYISKFWMLCWNIQAAEQGQGNHEIWKEWHLKKKNFTTGPSVRKKQPIPLLQKLNYQKCPAHQPEDLQRAQLIFHEAKKKHITSIKWELPVHVFPLLFWFGVGFLKKYKPCNKTTKLRQYPKCPCFTLINRQHPHTPRKESKHT